jgi:hypothetical protein
MLIIHHWDTDGICSAAKLVRILKPDDYVNMSPDVGDFSFGSRIRDSISEADDVFIVDLNLVKELDGIEKDITFIDHHIQERIGSSRVKQINPLVEGKDISEFPSCTVVISEHFDSWDLLSALGAIGDVGDKAFDHPRVKEQIDVAGITEEEAKKIVSLIDSNYLAVDLPSVERTVEEVLQLDPSGMLDHSEWNRKLDEIERTVEETIANRKEVGEFCYMDMSTPYNIISKLARKAVWELGYPGALVVNRDFHGKGQTYLRISSETAKGMDMASVISRLREIGINAGGKSEVVGSIYPRERIEEVLSVLGPKIGLKTLEDQ